MDNELKLVETFSNKNNAHAVYEFSMPDDKKGTICIHTNKYKDRNEAIVTVDGVGSRFGTQTTYNGPNTLENAKKAISKTVDLNSDDIREIIIANAVLSSAVNTK